MKFFKIFFILNILLFRSLSSFGQLGGRSVYDFLSLPYSAQISALGGKNVSSRKSDISMIYENPSYPTYSKQILSLNYSHLAGSINYGSVNYRVDKNWAIGILYVNYGRFTRANEKAFRFEKFSAGEYAFVLNYHKKISPKLSVGTNIKPILSFMEQYNSLGIASDWGLYYSDSSKLLYAGIVLKNLGFQLISYTEKNNERLPIELTIGITKELEHAPFAVSLTLHDLQKPILTYVLPQSTQNLFGTPATENSLVEKIGDNLLRHVILGLEIFPQKAFTLNLGYNYQQRRELSITTKSLFTGYSLGFRLNLKKFILNYSFNSYFIQRGNNQISFSFNPMTLGLRKRGTIIE